MRECPELQRGAGGRASETGTSDDSRGPILSQPDRPLPAHIPTAALAGTGASGRPDRAPHLHGPPLRHLRTHCLVAAGLPCGASEGPGRACSPEAADPGMPAGRWGLWSSGCCLYT